MPVIPRGGWIIIPGTTATRDSIITPPELNLDTPAGREKGQTEKRKKRQSTYKTVPVMKPSKTITEINNLHTSRHPVIHDPSTPWLGLGLLIAMVMILVTRRPCRISNFESGSRFKNTYHNYPPSGTRTCHCRLLRSSRSITAGRRSQGYRDERWQKRQKQLNVEAARAWSRWARSPEQTISGRASRWE